MSIKLMIVRLCLLTHYFKKLLLIHNRWNSVLLFSFYLLFFTFSSRKSFSTSFSFLNLGLPSFLYILTLKKDLIRLNN